MCYVLRGAFLIGLVRNVEKRYRTVGYTVFVFSAVKNLLKTYVKSFVTFKKICYNESNPLF